MELQERHKEFVVRGYAQFMDLSEIIDEFIGTFSEDIEEICGIPYIDEIQYLDKYVEQARKAEQEIEEKFREVYEYDEYLVYGEELFNEEIDPQNRKIYDILSSRFRRLDINHQRFPKKYRKLFQQARLDYFRQLQTKNLDNPYNAIEELESLFNVVKKQILEEQDFTKIPLAHQIIKSIITSKKMVAQKHVQGSKSLPEISPPETEEA